MNISVPLFIAYLLLIPMHTGELSLHSHAGSTIFCLRFWTYRPEQRGRLFKINDVVTMHAKL